MTDDGIDPLVPAGSVDAVVLDVVDDVPVPPAELWSPVSPPATGCEGAEAIAAPVLPVDVVVAGLVGVVGVPAGWTGELPPDVEPDAASCGTVAGGTMRTGSVGVTFAVAGVVFAGADDVGAGGVIGVDCAAAVFGAVSAGPVMPGVVDGAVGGGNVVVPDGVEGVGVVGVCPGVVVAGGVTVTVVRTDVAGAGPASEASATCPPAESFALPAVGAGIGTGVVSGTAMADTATPSASS